MESTATTRETVCTKLHAFMDANKLRGIWLPNVRISRAPASGVNAGALYLKSQYGDYLGKILADGTVRTLYALAPVIKDELRAVVTEGAEYLARTGRETGQCCFCGLELTDPESVERGYGPVCAKKYGLEHANRHGF